MDDPKFISAAIQDGYEIQLICQLLNSLDVNILDLGFFNAIQSPHHIHALNTIDDDVDDVKEAYENMSTQILNKVFHTLQHCMIKTMKKGGCIRYKFPHMRKDRLQQEGILPIQLS